MIHRKCQTCRLYDLEDTEKKVCQYCVFQMLQFLDVGMILLMNLFMVAGYKGVHLFTVILRLGFGPVRAKRFHQMDKSGLWLVMTLFFYWFLPDIVPMWVHFGLTVADVFFTLVWSMSFLDRVYNGHVSIAEPHRPV